MTTTIFSHLDHQHSFPFVCLSGCVLERHDHHENHVLVHYCNTNVNRYQGWWLNVMTTTTILFTTIMYLLESCVSSPLRHTSSGYEVVVLARHDQPPSLYHNYVC